MVKTKRRSLKSKKIKDPQFSKKIHKGTMASKTSINYEYQDYDNIIDTLELIVSDNDKLMKEVKFFKKDPINAFLTLDLYKKDRIYPEYMKMKDFKKELLRLVKNKTGKTIFIPIILNIRYTKKDNHANMIIINLQTKEIELFEPHGFRQSDSVIGGMEGGYKKKYLFVEKFFKKHLPDFHLNNVMSPVPGRSFQVLHDPKQHTGYCVTWCMMYSNYRILNPKLSSEELIRYMHAKINQRLLLQYASYSELLLKGK